MPGSSLVPGLRHPGPALAGRAAIRSFRGSVVPNNSGVHPREGCGRRRQQRRCSPTAPGAQQPQRRREVGRPRSPERWSP
eukprot:7955987-Alexandrium_andersonii.AAC.1